MNPDKPADMIPGAREPGLLTTFGVPVAAAAVAVGDRTMGTGRTGEGRREGGGGPRRPLDRTRARA